MIVRVVIFGKARLAGVLLAFFHCPSGDYQGMNKTRLAVYDPSTRVVADERRKAANVAFHCGVVIWDLTVDV